MCTLRNPGPRPTHDDADHVTGCTMLQAAQQAALSSLVQRYQMQEQARLLQRQQVRALLHLLLRTDPGCGVWSRWAAAHLCTVQAMQQMQQQGNGHARDHMLEQQQLQQQQLQQQQQQRFPVQAFHPRLPVHLQGAPSGASAQLTHAPMLASLPEPVCVLGNLGAGLSPRAAPASHYMIPITQPSLPAPAEPGGPPSSGTIQCSMHVTAWLGMCLQCLTIIVRLYGCQGQLSGAGAIPTSSHACMPAWAARRRRCPQARRSRCR